MALVALFQFGFGELAFGAFEQFLAQGLVQLIRQSGITRQKTVFQQGRANGEIFAPQPQAIGDGAAGMTHFQTQVPQDIKHAFNHTFCPRGDFGRRQKQQIDIRFRGHFTTAISAHRADGDALSFGWVGQWVQDTRGQIKHCQDQAIGQPAI